MTYVDIITRGVYGFLAGGASGLITLRRKYPKTAINFWKMAPTLAITSLAGLVVGLQGLTIDNATLDMTMTMLLSAGADSLIGDAIKWAKETYDKR